MKAYRYGFNEDGYYTGLVYSTKDQATGEPIFPINCTDREPYWKDGYYPKFDFTTMNWGLEPRHERHIRLAVEAQILSKMKLEIYEYFNEQIEKLRYDLSQSIIQNRYDLCKYCNDLFKENLHISLKNLNLLNEHITNLSKIDADESKQHLGQIMSALSVIEHRSRPKTPWYKKFWRKLFSKYKANVTYET